MRDKFLQTLRQLSACRNAELWAECNSDPEHAWATCTDGEWMLWIASRLSIRHATVIQAACSCVRATLQNQPAEEWLVAVNSGLDVLERWASGKATSAEVAQVLEDLGVRPCFIVAYPYSRYVDAVWRLAYCILNPTIHAEWQAVGWANHLDCDNIKNMFATLVREHIPWSMANDAWQQFLAAREGR